MLTNLKRKTQKIINDLGRKDFEVLKAEEDNRRET